MNYTLSAPKGAIDHEKLIAAIEQAPAPPAGWGDIKVVQEPGRREYKHGAVRIEFSKWNSADRLREHLGFGTVCHVRGVESALRIARPKAWRLILDLNRKGRESQSSNLQPGATSELDRIAAAIDVAKARTVESILEIGRHLKEAHALLANHGDGQFNSWVQDRCGFTPQTARNYMNLVEAFGGEDCKSLLQNSSIEALYLLSKDSTPEEAVEQAAKLAKRGVRVTLEKAKEVIGQHIAKVEGSSGIESVDEEDDGDDRPLEQLSDDEAVVSLPVHFENACRHADEFIELCKARMQESDITVAELVEIAKQCGDVAERLKVTTIKFQRSAGTLIAELHLDEEVQS